MSDFTRANNFITILREKVMKYVLTVTRKADGKTFVKSFKSKKDLQRFQSNNYTIYTW